MNDHHDHHDHLVQRIRTGLGDPDLPIPVETIVANGRARRRRRMVTAFAGTGAAAVAVTAAMIPTFDRTAPPSASGATVSTQLAAYALVGNPNGTRTLTLLKQRAVDPDALTRALAEAGIAAHITIGEMCEGHGVATKGALEQVLTSGRTPNGDVTLTIDPAAIPHNSQLSIGFRAPSDPSTKDRARFTLVPTHGSLACAPFGPTPHR